MINTDNQWFSHALTTNISTFSYITSMISMNVPHFIPRCMQYTYVTREVTVVLQTDINVIHIEPQLVGQLESCPFTFCVTAVMIGGVNRLVDYICISQSDTSTISISSLVQNPSTLSRQQWPNTVVHKFYNCGTCCHETTMAPHTTLHSWPSQDDFHSYFCYCAAHGAVLPR